MAALDTWLDQLVERGGTDLHLASGYPPLARVGDALVNLSEGPLDAGTLDAWMFELLDPAQRSSFEQKGDLAFAYSHREDSTFRAHYASSHGGNRAVFRHRSAVADVQQLQLPQALVSAVYGLTGLVLVVGPRSCGKSTTAAALVQSIASREPVHIAVVEAPLELPLQSEVAHVTLKEVGTHAPTLDAAITSLSREDVDVAYIGVLEDGAAIQSALTLANSGPQVIATLDTPHVAAALDLIEASAPEGQGAAWLSTLSDCLTAIVAQHRLPRAEGEGVETVFELLLGTEAIRGTLREGDLSQIPAVIHAGRKEGMLELDLELGRLVKAGTIRVEDAERAAVDPEAFGSKR